MISSKACTWQAEIFLSFLQKSKGLFFAVAHFSDHCKLLGSVFVRTCRGPIVLKCHVDPPPNTVQTIFAIF